MNWPTDELANKQTNELTNKRTIHKTTSQDTAKPANRQTSKPWNHQTTKLPNQPYQHLLQNQKEIGRFCQSAPEWPFHSDCGQKTKMRILGRPKWEFWVFVTSTFTFCVSKVSSTTAQWINNMPRPYSSARGPPLFFSTSKLGFFSRQPGAQGQLYKKSLLKALAPIFVFYVRAKKEHFFSQLIHFFIGLRATKRPCLIKNGDNFAEVSIDKKKDIFPQISV